MTNHSTYYINTSQDGMVIDLTFSLKGDIIPVLYTTTGGVINYVSWEDIRVGELQKIGPTTFRVSFLQPYEGYVYLLAIQDDAVTIDEQIKLINTTLITHAQAIGDRVYVEAWKEMNTYLEARIIALEKKLELTNSVVANLQAQVQILLNESNT